AGSAADFYSRLKPIGICSTTYGVGAFNLYDAIAGAFVERCPVVLVNGSANATKARQLVEQGVKFAHAIDTLRTDELIFRPITAATTVITDPEDAPSEIDGVLRACVTEKRPVYLEVRDGVWIQSCDDPPDPDDPLAALPLPPDVDNDFDRATEAAVRDVLERLDKAKHPVLWG